MAEFNNQVAVITGAGSASGREIAKKLGLEGALVYLLDADESALVECYAELKKLHISVEKFIVDPTNEFDIAKVFNKIKESHGKLDILVNNYEVSYEKTTNKWSAEGWEQGMDVHLKGVFLCSKYAQEIMITNLYGRIINLSSVSILENREQANYSAARAGIQWFTKSLASELNQYNVTVNVVVAEFAATKKTIPSIEEIGVSCEQLKKEKRSQTSIKYVGFPEDIAHATSFFASTKASFISGQVLYVVDSTGDLEV